MIAASLSGCLYFFDGDDNDKACPLDQPAGATAPQRNPDDLTCQTFGYPCDPECGPCPGVAATALAPLPSWGICGSTCEALAEDACARREDCRVVKDVACAISGTCETDFLGCFPTDTYVEPGVDCGAARDGYTCSTSPACTAFHVSEPCLGDPQGECPRAFALCMPEGQSPGRCHDPVACRALPPACPSGTTPGIANSCYTGACIPVELCEPVLGR